MNLPTHNQLEEWWLRELDRHIEGEQPRYNGKYVKADKPATPDLELFKTDFERWLNLYPPREDRKNYDYLKFQTEEKPEEKDGNFFYEKYKECLLLEQAEEQRWKKEYEAMKAQAEANNMEVLEYVEYQRQYQNE
jgi:hypothetical protein